VIAATNRRFLETKRSDLDGDVPERIFELLL